MKIKFVNHRTKIRRHATAAFVFQGESDSLKQKKNNKKLISKVENQNFMIDLTPQTVNARDKISPCLFLVFCEICKMFFTPPAYAKSRLVEKKRHSLKFS